MRDAIGFLAATVACLSATGAHGTACVDYTQTPPSEVGGLPTPYYSAFNQVFIKNMELVGDHLLVTSTTGFDWAGGLEVVDVSNPASPQSLGSVPMPSQDSVYGLATIGTTAYVSTNTNVNIIQTDPTPPAIVGSFGAPLGEVYVDTAQSRLYHIRSVFLDVYSVAAPLAPSLLGTLDLTGHGFPGGVAFDGDRVYIVTSLSQTELITVDVSSPGSPQVIDTDTIAYGGRDVLLRDNTLYIGADDLQIADVTDRDDPHVQASSWLSGLKVHELAEAGGVLYATTNTPGIHVLELQGWSQPVLEYTIPKSWHSFALVSDANYLYFDDVDTLRAWPAHCSSVTSVVETAAALPVGGIRLLPPAPNPAPGRTTIAFELTRPARITVEVLDVQGRLVRRWSLGGLPAGPHQTRWNGLANGRPVPAGLYLVRVSDGSDSRSAKLVLTRQ